MLLCSIFFLAGLFSTTAVPSPLHAVSRIFSHCDSRKNLDFSHQNRTRRDDKLKYTSVCSELDSTEDTPFVAMIVTRNRGRLLCMGSIIDEYHVLTAKRCFEKGDASAIMVVAGYQSPYWGKNSQVKYVEKVVKNEKELAMLLLKKSFLFTETVQPIRLVGPDKIISEFDVAYSTPFKSFGIVGIQVPKYLHQGDLLPKMAAYFLVLEPPVPNGDCDTALAAEGGAITETDKQFMFCTNGKSEFCWTATGSPTVVTMEKNYVQIGVVIYAKCKTNKPPGAPKSRFRRAPPPPNADDKDKYAPNVHIRIDKLHKWITANSYIGVK